MITAIHRSLAAKREQLKNDEQGFTLIELLVVVLIIGILTAIAVPVFLGQQNQAKDAAAKSDLGILKVAVISYATANNGTYPAAAEVTGAVATELGAFGYVKSDGVGTTTIITATSSEFCASAVSGSGTTFYITHDEGASETDCS